MVDDWYKFADTNSTLTYIKGFSDMIGKDVHTLKINNNTFVRKTQDLTLVCFKK